MMSRREIAAMRTVIAPHIRRTPVVDVGMETSREPVSLKLETLQHTGSFKARGAFANLVGATVPAALALGTAAFGADAALAAGEAALPFVDLAFAADAAFVADAAFGSAVASAFFVAGRCLVVVATLTSLVRRRAASAHEWFGSAPPAPGRACRSSVRFR